MLLTLFAFLLATSLRAQMVLLEFDEGSPRSTISPEEIPFIPQLGVTHDQYLYAPLSDGVLLLCCLGGGWLFWNGKRKTENGKRKTENGERKTE